MANIALDAGKVVLKDGKASCTCCAADPCASIPRACLVGPGGVANANFAKDGEGCTAEFYWPGCNNPVILTNSFLAQIICGGDWVLLASGIADQYCLGGLDGTFYFCKSDGIDSPFGDYSGVCNLGYVTFNVIECI